MRDMASITSTNGADDILMFGSYYQTTVAMEPDMVLRNLVNDQRLLRPEA